MKRFAPLFTAVLLGLSLAAIAEDHDAGGSDRHMYYGGRDGHNRTPEFNLPLVGASGLTPLYYRPTMRYYGNGYTVSYRYIPVYAQQSIYVGGTGGSSNFRTEAFHIPTDEIPSWGASSPRLTVKDAKSSTRTPVTSIIRKKTASTTKTKGGATDVVPGELPSVAPVPAPDAAPVPDKPAQAKP